MNENNDEVKSYIKNTIRDRDALCDTLEQIGYEVIRSHTNSIHFHEVSGDNSHTVNIMNKHGLAFKSGDTITGTSVSIPGDDRKTWIRLSVGEGINTLPFIKELT